MEVSKKATTSFQNKKVLLVESDPYLKTAIEIFFQSLMVDFTSAWDEEDAKVKLSEKKFDVLVCSFQLRAGNGADLLSWCRKTKLHLPVVFLSEKQALVDREKIALEDCCATLIQKPIQLIELEKALHAALERSHHSHCVHNTF